MKKLKHAAIALVAIKLMTSYALASEAPAEPTQTPTVSPFSQPEITSMFDRSEKPLEIAALSEQEMRETEGAVWQYAIGAASGFGFYAATNWYNNRPITWQGSIHSLATGAITGGVGGALIRASGGGIAGNIAWRPNIISANFGSSKYRSYRGW